MRVLNVVGHKAYATNVLSLNAIRNLRREYIMAKKPSQKAISQFQALAQKSTPAPMKPMMPMPGMPPKAKPNKKPMAKNGLGIVKGAIPKMEGKATKKDKLSPFDKMQAKKKGMGM
jgi:hypothetical protein